MPDMPVIAADNLRHREGKEFVQFLCPSFHIPTVAWHGVSAVGLSRPREAAALPHLSDDDDFHDFFAKIMPLRRRTSRSETIWIDEDKRPQSNP